MTFNLIRPSPICKIISPILFEKLRTSVVSPCFHWRNNFLEKSLIHSRYIWNNFRVLGNIPNTYAYTKSLSEALVVEKIQSKSVPAIILRPSIVIPIRHDPIPGWVSLSINWIITLLNNHIVLLQTDNINGPTGLLIGAGKGVIRSMYCNSSGYGDYLPVDFAVNGILICSWNYLGNRFVTLTIRYQFFNFSFLSNDFSETSIGVSITWQVQLNIRFHGSKS